jgi:preprotein translocase subunit SecE
MAEKKAGREGKIGKFFRSVMAELKKVSWPTHRETVVYTVVVISTVLVVSTVIFLFDQILTAIAGLIYS